MILKSIEEIGKIRESALVVSKTLGMLASEIKPGVNFLYLFPKFQLEIQLFYLFLKNLYRK